MAQIIQFPCGTASQEPAPVVITQRRASKPKIAAPSKVSPIKRGVRIPKANRPEDDHAAMLDEEQAALIAKSEARKAARAAKKRGA
jgi:hypothetical protein